MSDPSRAASFTCELCDVGRECSGPMAGGLEHYAAVHVLARNPQIAVAWFHGLLLSTSRPEAHGRLTWRNESLSASPMAVNAPFACAMNASAWSNLPPARHMLALCSDSFPLRE
eukprot:1262690-Rhodomonas_salina.2